MLRLAGDHLCGKLLFTWLSLVMSLFVSSCAFFFARDVLDVICDLIESVSEGFLTYSLVYMSIISEDGSTVALVNMPIISEYGSTVALVYMSIISEDGSAVALVYMIKIREDGSTVA